jgi:two-component system, OmpR family, alkaline phosphatase synthesis response regulator PhoP
MSLIYCVEDDENIRELVSYALRGQGYNAMGFPDAKALSAALLQNVPDLLLLDIMLPGKDGLTILTELRAQKEYADIPVIIMTAKSGEFDIVRGLDLGADDYVTKPFGIMELLSRIRSVLRRAKRKEKEEAPTLSLGNVSVDCRRHIVTAGKEEIPLTLKEYDLLCYLLLNQGIVLTREQIMQAVWSAPFEMESRTIDMHIMSLRQKLGDAGALIRTVRGVGYRMGEK